MKAIVDSVWNATPDQVMSVVEHWAMVYVIAMAIALVAAYFFTKRMFRKH